MKRAYLKRHRDVSAGDCLGFVYPLKSNPHQTCYCDKCNQQIDRRQIEAKGVDYLQMILNTEAYNKKVKGK